MRIPIVGIVFLLLASAGHCEEPATALVAQLPHIPGDLCDPAPKAITEFKGELDKIARKIDAALADHNRQQKEYVKQHESEWRDQMIKQSGLTPEQIAKAKADAKSKDPKVRAAAKRQLAEQALQQYADLTIDEARQLKKMSEEEKKGWKEAYASQEIATAQAAAQSRTPEEQAADEKKRERLAKLAHLADDQKKLMENIGAGRELILQKMRQLESDAQTKREESIGPIDLQIDSAKKESDALQEQMDREMQPYRENLKDRPLSDEEAHAVGEIQKRYEERFSELRRRIEDLERQKTDSLGTLCATYSPRYAGLIQEYIEWALFALPDFDRYEAMESEKFGLQMNAPGMQPMVVPGTLGMEEAHACVDLLRSFDKYSTEYRNRRTTPSAAAGSGAAP